MEKQISAMHSTLRMQGRYQSFIVQLPQAETAEGLIRYMAFRQIQQRLKDIFQAEWGWIYFLRPEGDHSVFVVQYRQEFSVAKIKQVHQVMVSELKQNLDAVCADVLFVHGRVYQDLFNISMSYHEAKEELRKLCYYEAEGDGEANTAQRISVHDGYFTSQLQQLQVYLKNGEVVLGENLLTQLLKELCVSEGGIDPIRSWHMRILDILVEKALDFRTEGDKLGNLEYQMLYRQLELCTDQKTMYLFMVKETSKLLETLKKEINKKQHRLISRAKEYMQQHYSDSSLSIHQIAESVGISDTYLSSIFTEFTGENLVSYLNSYRVTIAKDLLINTRIIIKDIGFKTGFNTVQNFNRVFKRFTGMTPGDYRKQNKADDGENP